MAAGELNRWHAELVALTGRLVEEELWGGGGFRSPEHWLTVRAGLSPARAQDVVLVARRRGELPTVSGQLAGGVISIDQAVVVAKYAPASYEASVGGFTPLATVTQLRRSLTRYAFADPVAAPDPAVAPDPAAAPRDRDGDRPAGAQSLAHQVAVDVAGAAVDVEPGVADVAPGAAEVAPAPAVGSGGRGAAFGVDRWSRAGLAGRAGEVSVRYDGGRFILHANLPAGEGALVEQALREAKDALIRSGTSSAVTAADALVEIAGRSLATVDAVPSRAGRYRVYVHVDTRGAWVNGRGAIPAHLAARYACVGDAQPVWERDGHPVNVGRRQRAVPDRLRRLVEDRDRGCVFPGCTATSYVEIHHVEHWADGGPTDYDRLVSLCCWHHDAHHRGDYTIAVAAGCPGRFTFHNRSGPIHAGPPLAPTGGPGSGPGPGTPDPGGESGDAGATDPGGGSPNLGGSSIKPEGGATGPDGAGPAVVGARPDPGWTGPPYAGPTGERLSLNWVMFYDNDTYYGQAWSPPRPDPTIDP